MTSLQGVRRGVEREAWGGRHRKCTASLYIILRI